MTATAEAVLEQLRTLPRAELEEVYQRLLRLLDSTPPIPTKSFPTLRVSGGAITSEQVAESLDDE